MSQILGTQELHEYSREMHVVIYIHKIYISFKNQRQINSYNPKLACNLDVDIANVQPRIHRVHSSTKVQKHLDTKISDKIMKKFICI